MRIPIGVVMACLLLGGLRAAAEPSFESAPSPKPVQYLAFQIFLRSSERDQSRAFPPGKDVASTVNDFVGAIGTTGHGTRRLGFIVGPLSFDDTTNQVRAVIRDAFDVALKNNIALGFHIDDSKFWGRLSALNTHDNVEWLDWSGTPSTGRRIDWSATPIKLMPQLCYNSPAVKAAVEERALLIGEEVKRGLGALKAAGKADLFIGVIAGWETELGKDFDTGKSLGYCALTHEGYSAQNPPADIDAARAEIVREFINLWASSLARAGVPDDRIFSHIGFLATRTYGTSYLTSTYLEATRFSPAYTAFGPHHHPGFSTYPEAGHTDEILKELAQNGNGQWISAEGTALDPALAAPGASGGSMESYLAGLFDHGAVLVNVFGWGVGSSDNAFRKTAEGPDAIAAYRKFLNGSTLSDSASGDSGHSLPAKIQLALEKGRQWIQAHPEDRQKLLSLFAELDHDIKNRKFQEAGNIVDQITNMIASR